MNFKKLDVADAARGQADLFREIEHAADGQHGARNDGRIDVKFTDQNLVVDTSVISGIPYHYSVEVEIRRWN